MRRKQTPGSKTDRFIRLILEIAQRPSWEISEVKLKEYLGNPSKSQFYNYIAELTQDTMDRPALLFKVKRESGFFYKLHDQTWEQFYLARQEGSFLLEAHRKLGHLLESGLQESELFPEFSRPNHLSRKFIYLSAIKARPYSNEQKELLQTIVQGLLGDRQLELHYNDKMYQIFPLSLCQYRDELYLLAFSGKIAKENLRTFKLPRVQEVKTLPESFDYPTPSVWDPQNLYKDSSGLVLGSKKSALIRVFGHARELIAEKNFFSNTLKAKGETWTDYEVLYTSEEEFLGQMFTYADEIEILSPLNLRDSFRRKAEKAVLRNATADDFCGDKAA